MRRTHMLLRKKHAHGYEAFGQLPRHKRAVPHASQPHHTGLISARKYLPIDDRSGSCHSCRYKTSL